jgi:RNA polymerase sigma-70 factor (ECF subfamily)
MTRNAVDFDAIYREYAPKVRALARRRLPGRDISEDIVQEVFVRALRALPELDLDRPLWPWLRTVCINVCTDVLRAPRTWAEESVDDVPDRVNDTASGSDPAASLIAAEHRLLIADALHTLAPRQREILLKRVVDGATTEAMAASDGSTIDAIKSAVKRGRTGFRAAYHELGAERGLLGGTPAPVPVPVGLVRGTWVRVRRLADACVRACNVEPSWQSVPVFVSAALLAIGAAVLAQHDGDTAAAAPPSSADVLLARDASGSASAPTSSPATTRPGEGGAPPSAPPGHDQGPVAPAKPPLGSVTFTQGIDHDDPKNAFHWNVDVTVAGHKAGYHGSDQMLCWNGAVHQMSCDVVDAANDATGRQYGYWAES